MKKKLLLAALTVFLAGGVSNAKAASYRAASRSVRLAGAPPVTARRPAPTRRLLAIEYVRQAALAYGRGDYKRTLALCQTASDWYPTYARAHIWKGAAYQKLGNYAQARSSYSWGRALSPDSADAARANRGLKELGYY